MASSNSPLDKCSFAEISKSSSASFCGAGQSGAEHWDCNHGGCFGGVIWGNL